MAFPIRWTAAAAEDLIEAAEYIERDSPYYAAYLVAQARTAAKSLRSMPNRGRLVPERSDPKLLELLVGRYRLIYKIRPSGIAIIGFIHGARELQRILDERLD